MAHYALLDSNNVVVQVIVGRDENEMDTDWEQYYSQITGLTCKRTSYNTRGGIYYNSETNQPHQDQTKSYRKNYAGINYTYDAQLDAFIPPKPEFNLLEYNLESTSATWVVANVNVSNTVPFVDNTIGYILTYTSSAVLRINENQQYYFLYSIDTNVLIDYQNKPSN